MEKERFLDWLEKNRIGQLICFLTLEVFIVGLYFIGGNWLEEKGKKERLSTQAIVVDYKVLAQIEEVSQEEDSLIFSGWAFRLQSQKKDLDIILEEVDSKKALVFDTKSFSRDDLETEFDLMRNYGEAGFIAELPSRKIDSDICYEVQLGLSYVENEKEEKIVKISTNRYLYDGEVYRYNPLKFVEPEVKNQEITEVIKHGDLCAYSSERNIWIYQYADKLYWFLDKSYISSLREASGIPCILYSYQDESISSGLFNDGGFERYDIFFDESDLVMGENTSYYFVSRELPMGYPITYIQTGNWSSKNAWLYNAVFQVYKYEKE